MSHGFSATSRWCERWSRSRDQSQAEMRSRTSCVVSTRKKAGCRIDRPRRRPPPARSLERKAASEWRDAARPEAGHLSHCADTYRRVRPNGRRVDALGRGVRPSRQGTGNSHRSRTAQSRCSCRHDGRVRAGAARASVSPTVFIRWSDGREGPSTVQAETDMGSESSAP